MGGVIWSGAETGLKTQLYLWLSTEGGQETGDPIPHLVILKSTMVRSPVLLGAIFLSVFPGPSGADRDMPKLAEWKLCADEECSRKSQGRRARG